MTVNIIDGLCEFTTPHGPVKCPASQLTVITDADKAMSAVELNGERIYLTEAEVDELTVAGAVDGRQHLKATDRGSAI